jgi:hypothetical protein
MGALKDPQREKTNDIFGHAVAQRPGGEEVLFSIFSKGPDS